MQNYICCFGEVLWDLLPSGRLPGGAPMNVATHLQNLGITSAVISRVGNDELGQEIRAFLEDKNCTTDFLQTDNQHPTGKVNVFLSEKHEATYEIVQPVAWDFISISPETIDLVKNANALIFGSLACRDTHTRDTLLSLIEVASLKIFDVNFRPPHYSQQLIEMFLHKADIVKMNDDELDIIAAWYDLSERNNQEILTHLKEKFTLKTLIVTKGSNGAMLIDNQGFFESKGFKVEVMDTIGSGDSFLAGFLKNYLSGNSPEYSLTYACALGALVASHKGANPKIDEMDILKMIEKESCTA